MAYDRLRDFFRLELERRKQKWKEEYVRTQGIERLDMNQENVARAGLYQNPEFLQKMTATYRGSYPREFWEHCTSLHVAPVNGLSTLARKTKKILINHLPTGEEGSTFDLVFHGSIENVIKEIETILDQEEKTTDPDQLTDLRKIIRKSIDACETVNEQVCLDGLLCIAAHEIQRIYKLLIPNENNLKAAFAFREWMDNPPLVCEAEKSNDEYEIFHLLRGPILKGALEEEILNGFIRHCIIVKRGVELNLFEKYYASFTRNGRVFTRIHYEFKRTETKEPYTRPFQERLFQYLDFPGVRIISSEWIDRFDMNIELTDLVPQDLGLLKQAIFEENLSLLQTWLAGHHSFIRSVKERLTFEQVQFRSNKATICLSKKDVIGMGLDLSLFEDYKGDSLKTADRDRPHGKRLKIARYIYLLVADRPEEENKIYTRIRLSLGAEQDYFQTVLHMVK